MKNVTKPDKLPQNFSIYGNIQYTGKYNKRKMDLLKLSIIDWIRYDAYQT